MPVSTPLPELDRVLVIKPGIRLEILDERTAYLIGERQRFLLGDARMVEVASLIDGRRTVDDILRASQGSEAQSLYVVGQLMSRGYVVEGFSELDAGNAAHWYGLGLPTAQYH